MEAAGEAEAAAAAAVAVAAGLRLVAALLAPCVALLCCLNGLLLLRRRRRPPGGRTRGTGPGLPQPPGTLPSGGGGGGGGAPVAGGSAGLLFPQPCLCGRRGQRRAGPAGGSSSSSSSSSSASDLQRRPLLAPPNSPARGVPESAFGRQHPSTQRKAPSCRPAFPTRLHPSPFEYSSSIQRGDKRAQLSSANLTASQGPGLDSDFGASAGVSLRILSSSDSEESPPAPLPHPQQSGRFEWDYYDPSYKKSPALQCHLPCICSKQYWL